MDLGGMSREIILLKKCRRIQCADLVVLSTHISKKGNFSLGRDKKLRVPFLHYFVWKYGSPNKSL